MYNKVWYIIYTMWGFNVHLVLKIKIKILISSRVDILFLMREVNTEIQISMLVFIDINRSNYILEFWTRIVVTRVWGTCRH